MTDAECVAFLQWALPRLGRRWAGYRRVRASVCKRIDRRVRGLALAGPQGYRRWLEADRREWAALDALLGIPISRFYRDRPVFESLERDVLPALARRALRGGRRVLACWSAGCASGEEPYTLALLWRQRLRPLFPRLALRVVATDRDAVLIERARAGCYKASSLKALPADLRAAAFEPNDALLCLRASYRDVEFRREDLRARMPQGPFDLVLCRNAVATYYATELQHALFGRIARRMRPGAALVLGAHESLPEDLRIFAAWPGARGVFRKAAADDGG